MLDKSYKYIGGTHMPEMEDGKTKLLEATTQGMEDVC
jgi:hypothetical protein